MAHRFRGGGAERPVVLLLGWLGGKDAHVNKYAAMYRELGAQVVSHQPSILQTAVPEAADRRLLRFMKDFTWQYSSLCTVRGETPPVLVHAMSNAGFIAFGTMLHLTSLLQHSRVQPLSPASGGNTMPPQLEFNPSMWRRGGGGGGMTARSYGLWGATEGQQPGGWRLGEEPGVHPFVRDPPSLAVLSAFRQVLKNTQGIVLDSAPSLATPVIWSRGLLSAVFSKPAHEVEETHPLLMRAAHRVAERYLLMPAIVQRIREIRHAWQYSVPPCPQLYLYSKADALIPHHHIERFMEQQEAHGVPVFHHCWDDAAHCELYRKHPEQYKSLVRSFSEHCLRGHTPPESWI